MTMKTAFRISALALGCALYAASPALADSHHDASSGMHGGWHGGGWHGGAHGGFVPMHRFVGHDFAHFSVADRAMWRGGRWWHGPWHGRSGWWWFAGGGWYFYDTPIYPYPGYVSDYYVGDDYADYPDSAAPGANPYSWYYCQNPPGYYPYIQSCNGPWRPVPAGAPPQGYQSGPADQGPPPGYNNGPNGPDDDQGPPPGYGPNGPGPNDQNGPPPGYGPNGSPPPNNGH
jgi:hypothetical protein